MINLDFVKLFNDLSGLILISFIIFIVFEVIKMIFEDKIPSWIKDPFAIYVGVIAFIITTIIAKVNGMSSPLIIGFGHGCVYGILEGSWFIIIKGFGKLFSNIIEWIKNKIGSDK